MTLKRRVSLIVRALLIGSFAWLIALFLARPATNSLAVEAPLLQSVQALGELHAVKYTYRDVNDFETSREPIQWLASIPGGTELVHAATRNTATLSMTGTVEAGVDLSKARINKSANGIEVVLPAPRMYPANITAKVHDVSRGLFWRDNSIAASAIESAKSRIAGYARSQGIFTQAKANVKKQVEELVADLGVANATVRFQDSAAASQ